jgi:hypothetical protein
MHGLFDEWSRSGEYFVFLYSDTNQQYLVSNSYQYEGHTQLWLIRELLPTFLILAVIMLIIITTGILIETYILKRRFLRDLFVFDSKEEEKKDE